MYSLLIHFYAFIIALISPFHKKARAMRCGQWKTNDILRQKIDRNAKYVWFHASSLGEFEQGRPLMERIKAEHPEYKILLTFFSPSGYEVRKNYNGADVICYLPFDTPYRVKKFLDLANPSMAIFIKYEFWGNYLSELKKRHIPLFIISAIFRRDQLFFQWFGYPYRKMLYCFDHLFVQDDRSAELLRSFHINNVTVAGDTRFDRVLNVCKQAHELPFIQRFIGGEEAKRPFVFIAGSSWPQDEEILIPYFNKHPEMKLIIAPHEIHHEHLHYIESLLERPSVLLSQAMKDESCVDKADCFIVDGFGLLSSIYRYGDVAYIGGGFGAGIHNTLEAAVYGIPVIFGPRYHKFQEAKDLIKVGGGFSISNEKEFTAKLDEFMTNSDILSTAGRNAGNFVQSKAGTTDTIYKALPL